MIKIQKEQWYTMRDVLMITGKNSQQINYYIKTKFIKPNEYKQSSPNRWHKKILLWEAVLRILQFYS